MSGSDPWRAVAAAGARPPAEPAAIHVPVASATAAGRPARWLGAARPRTLTAAVVPVVVGLALAAQGGRIDLALALLTLAAAVLLQVGTNLANDYYDFVHGADTAERLGPRRLTATGGAAPATVRGAAFGVLALAALVGAPLVVAGGWPIALVGVLSLVAALAYTTGPWPLAYHGLGEPFVFVFFGPVAVNGTLYLQGGPLDGASLLAALPVACLATAILVVNNLRDLATDARAGKRTLAVRLGVRGTRVEYALLVAAAFGAVPVLAVREGAGVLLALAALPLAARETRRVGRRTGAGLNASLAGTARLHLVVGLLLALGLAL